MFDHVKFGVSDYATSKAFLRRTASSLAHRIRLHCACTKPRRSRRIFTWRSRPRIASKSKLSIARRWRRAAKTMVRLVCARTTTRTTMQLLSLVRTGTTSKWFATNPRPDLPSSGLARLGRLSDQTLGVRYSAVFGRNGGQGERNVDCKTLSADSSTEVQSGAKVLRDACDD